MKFVIPFAITIAVAFIPAQAWASGELGLSTDGAHWAPNLTTPLFDPAFRWVPGDTGNASFWVRNQSSDKAILDVRVLGDAVDSLMRTGDLSVQVKAADGSGSSTSLAGEHVLISSRQVSPGQEERIDVTVAFDRTSTNKSQVKVLDLQFEVRLTQDVSNGGSDLSDSDGSGDSDTDSDSSDRNGILPGTGGPVWWLLPAGSLGIATGWLIVAAGRRREASDV